MIARKYNFKLSPELIYLIESLKVEGYWNPEHYTAQIQNKNLPFLKRIESIIKKTGIRPYKRILIKIKLNDSSLSKNDIKLIRNAKNLSFHLETSPFDGSKRVVTSQPYSKTMTLELKIKDKVTSIQIKEEKEEFAVNSELKGYAYLSLVIPSRRFIQFISELVKDRKKLRIEPFLFNANQQFVMAALSALIDSEGSIDHYDLFRKIRIRMFNENYLGDWKVLLNKFEIGVRFSRNNEKEYELCIEGWEDFNRLHELGLKLHHSKKKKKFEEIMKSYKRNQVSRNSAENYYLNKIQEFGPITASELAIKLGKSKRVVNHYLKKLMDKNKIKVDKTKTAYKYLSKNR